MRIAFFSTHPFDRQPFEVANEKLGHQLVFLEAQLNEKTAELARACPAICAFVSDRLTDNVLTQLKSGGCELVALRSAGFNNVDLASAKRLGLTVARVPAYSPNAVAEHTIGLMLSLNRKIHRAYARTREHNFNLEGLLGFDMNGRTVGLIGVGRIGRIVARILLGFGCRVLAHDQRVDPELEASGVGFVSLPELLQSSDIVSLHCPLTKETHHLIDKDRIGLMKPCAFLINTSRGGLVDSKALLHALKHGQLKGLALDVYEEEEGVFFHDLSEKPLDDDVLARLLTFPNVLITAHQGFFTEEALSNIATTTLTNVTEFERFGQVPAANLVTT